MTGNRNFETGKMGSLVSMRNYVKLGWDGLGCIWQNGKDRDIRDIIQKIVNSCNNIEKQAKIERMREKKTLNV